MKITKRGFILAAQITLLGAFLITIGEQHLHIRYLQKSLLYNKWRVASMAGDINRYFINKQPSYEEFVKLAESAEDIDTAKHTILLRHGFSWPDACYATKLTFSNTSSLIEVSEYPEIPGLGRHGEKTEISVGKIVYDDGDICIPNYYKMSLLKRLDFVTTKE